MKFTGTLRAPRIDFQKFQRALHDELMEKLALAAFEWLNATARNIPQWSGASAATFLHLAREVGYSLPITQHGIAPNRVSRGLQQSDGGFDINQERARYFFKYRTTLAHLIYNESHNANITPDPTLISRLINPGPYHFQEKGRVAFLRVAADVRLPRPVLKFNKIKVK